MADPVADRLGHGLRLFVGLRGFLQEYARLVGIDPRRTADAYMSRLPAKR